MLANPLISVVVVNWNGKEYLKECFRTLVLQTYPHYEIILVDNGSSDGSVDFVVENFPQVRIVKLLKNHGFAGGNNRGLAFCEGEYIALLNNDTSVNKNWLENLLKPMQVDSTVGICASKLLVYGQGIIDSAGDFLTVWGVGFKRGCGKVSNSAYLNEGHVFGACAAAALYRRKMIEDIGFFDEEFFFNDEDTDLNFRAQLLGWKCTFVPAAVVYHKVNATIGKLSDLHVYYHTRNLEFLWVKNMPTGLMIRFVHYKILQEIGAFLYLCLRHGRWRAFFRGKRDALRMLPGMLKKRRDVQFKKQVSNQYIRSMFMPIYSRELIYQKIRQFIFG